MKPHNKKYYDRKCYWEAKRPGINVFLLKRLFTLNK